MKLGRDSGQSGNAAEMLKTGDFVTEVRITALVNVITHIKQIPFDYNHSGIENFIMTGSSYLTRCSKSLKESLIQ